jgi:hypothetical protein
VTGPRWVARPACPADVPDVPGATGAAGAVVEANAVCGAAASAPRTATAGAAWPARRATFAVGEGAVCRPILRNFLLLLCDFAAFKDPPYADARPATRHPPPLTRPENLLIGQHGSTRVSLRTNPDKKQI